MTLLRALVIPFAVAAILFTGSIDARDGSFKKAQLVGAVQAGPLICVAEHNIGNMAMTVTNKAMIGNDYHPMNDVFTGMTVRTCEFPIGSRQRYLFNASYWLGGIVGADTLVSTGTDGWQAGEEFNPDAAPMGTIRYRSTLSTLPQYRDSAISHQDFLATYWDTCLTCPGVRTDPVDHRPHRPLGVRIDERTYAWNYGYTRDFVLFSLSLTNILSNNIKNACFGIYVDGDVYAGQYYNGYDDDITGFIPSVPVPGTSCPASIDVPLGWIADNDGDLGRQDHLYVPHVTGTALLDVPVAPMTVSYNWWNSNTSSYLDFGPMRKANLRDFGTGGTGTPEGDRNKYWILLNGDIDYDQVFMASISPTDSIWTFIGPPLSEEYSVGIDTKYLLSVGPFDLAPGQSVPIVFAYVGGKDLHTDPDNLQNLPFDPWTYTSHLDFRDLKKNAAYASWVFDNPGVDTDSDGYMGTYAVCGVDTVWTTGDGVPDFRAAYPPARPQIVVSPISSGLYLTWNGRASETTVDLFSKRVDFEGYNVYLRRLGETNWQKIAGYDIEDYFPIAWDFDVSAWRPQPNAMTVSDLRCRYAPGGCSDVSWSPKTYTQSSPYILPGASDSVLYFQPVGCNASRFGFETAIQKSYPDAPKPRWNRPQDVPPDSMDLYVTSDGKFKYFEYRLSITGLLPGETYQVNVTPTDFGPAFIGASYPLEASADQGAVTVTTLPTNCCLGQTGNVDCDRANLTDIADLSTLIDYLYISLQPLCCPGAANLDGDVEGGVDMSDLARLIDYLYISQTPPVACR